MIDTATATETGSGAALKAVFLDLLEDRRQQPSVRVRAEVSRSGQDNGSLVSAPSLIARAFSREMTVVVPQESSDQPDALSGRLGYEVAVGALLLLAALGAWARHVRFRGLIHRARRPRPQAPLPTFSISRVDPPTRQLPVVLDGPTFRISIASADPADVVRVLTEVAAVELR